MAIVIYAKSLPHSLETDPDVRFNESGGSFSLPQESFAIRVTDGGVLVIEKVSRGRRWHLAPHRWDSVEKTFSPYV